MDSLQMDALAVVYLDQPVLHGTRRATFLHMSRGEAIIRYWGDSHAVAVPPEALMRRSERVPATIAKGERIPNGRARSPRTSARVAERSRTRRLLTGARMLG